jgi:hypothetical protein
MTFTDALEVCFSIALLFLVSYVIVCGVRWLTKK